MTRLARFRPHLHLLRARRPRVVRGPLIVLPGVLDPVATKVGEWFAAAMAEVVVPGERWLDLGCGTGVVGIALAKAGAIATCADIDAQAVRNAAANAALHGLHIDAVQSDLLAALPPRRFDKIAANLPFWPGVSSRPGLDRVLDRALYAGPDFEILRRFGETYRTVADAAFVVLSESGGDFIAARAALGPTRLVRRARIRGEWLDILAL